MLFLQFLNPQNMPTKSVKDMFHDVELLARGILTKESTLVSEQFPYGFCKMLEAKECVFYEPEKPGQEKINPKLKGVIDMKKFRIKLKRNEIDIEYLNQTLKKDNEYIMENDDEEDVFKN